MRFPIVFQSLRFKITAGAVLLLLLILGTFSYLQYQRHRDLLLNNLEQTTTAMGQVITSSLQHAMLTRDFSEIQKIVNDVAQQSEIVNLALLNKQGEIRIAPNGNGVGTQLSQQEPTCQVCHRFAPEQRPGSVILQQPDRRIFRTMTPIKNQAECFGCHDSVSRLNGVLLTDLSMATVDRQLADELRTSFFWTIGAILLTMVTINLLLSRLVLTKLERFVQAVQLFGRGDFGQRAALSGRDEIGKLAAAFNQMAEGLQIKDQENRQLYAELQQKEAARSQLLEALINAQEDERKRVARDLHDELGATLSGLTMSIEAAEQSLSNLNDPMKDRLQRTKVLATQALDETHKMILDLRPVALDELGLVSAIRADAETRLQPRGIEVQVDVNGERRRLDPQLELTLFRIAQEAVSNIARYANARRVDIAFGFRDSIVTVTIADDGRGFDPRSVSSSEDKTRGLGLLGMAERAHLADGTCQIESHAGQGTRITITMPAPMDYAKTSSLLSHGEILDV